MTPPAEFPDSAFVLAGEPQAIRDSGDVWHAFGRTAEQTAADLRGLDADTFVGDEGDTYRSRINQNLPPHLDCTAQAWSIVSTAVTTYASRLEELQAELSALRSSAYGQWSTDRSAAAAAKDQPAQPPADATATGLAAFLDRAAAVRAAHDDAVTACVTEIDRAKDLRFAEPPGWLGRLWQSACDWVAEHADVLQALSAVLKQISGIAAMLTWVPVIGPLAGAVAVGSAGLAFGIDATVKLATGEGDWTQICLDGLSIIPGARAAKAMIIADTSYTGVKVATGELDITDAAFALATNAGLARMGRAGGRPDAAMGHAARPEPDFDEQVLRAQHPANDYTATGHEIRYSTTATAIGNDAATIRNFTRSRGRRGAHDVVIHGTPHGEFALDPGSTEFINPMQVVAIVRANPHYRPGQPINLVTCHGGARPTSRTRPFRDRQRSAVVKDGTPSLAQEVADTLGCDVYASRKKVWLSERTGHMVESHRGKHAKVRFAHGPTAAPRPDPGSVDELWN